MSITRTADDVRTVDLTPADYTGPVYFFAAGIGVMGGVMPLGLFQDVDTALATASNSALPDVWVDVLPLNVAL